MNQQNPIFYKEKHFLLKKVLIVISDIRIIASVEKQQER